VKENTLTPVVETYLNLWEGQPTKPSWRFQLENHSHTLLDPALKFPNFRNQKFLLSVTLDYVTLIAVWNTNCQNEVCSWDGSLAYPTLSDSIASETDHTPTINESLSELSSTAITQHADIVPVEVAPPHTTPNPFASADAGYNVPVPAPVEYEYLIDSFEWTSAHIMGSNILNIEFPKALFLKPNVVAKLSEVRMQASNVRLKVKMTGTPFLSGKLVAHFIPRVAQAGAGYNNFGGSLRSFSHEDNQALVPGAIESFEMLLSRVPLTTFDYIGSDFTIGTLFFYVMTPLKQAGNAADPSPVQVSVYASFEDTKLAALGETDAPMSLISRLVDRIRNRKAKGHLKRINDLTPPTKQSSKGSTPAKEGEEKSRSGIISTILSTVGSLAPVLAVTPLAEIAPFAALAGKLSPVFRAIGLSKPNSVAAPTFVTRGQRRGMAQGSGLTIHERFGTHQDSILAATTSCGFRSDWDIRTLAQKGAFIGKFTFDSTSVQGYVLQVIPLTPTLCYGETAPGPGNYYPGHCAYFSQFFMRWRGSFKIVLEFVTTQFTTASVRITHNSYNEVSADVEEKSHVSTVADIRGYTVYKRLLPYISLKPWSKVIGFRPPSQTPLAADAELDSLELSVINPPRTTDGVGSSEVTCNIYFAGAGDIDFKDFIGFRLRPAMCEVPVPPSKQSMKSLFSDDFPSIHPALVAREYGLVRSETETSILELCKKEVRLDKTTVVDWPTNPYYSMALSNISQLIRCFQFYRGSTNYRFCQENPVIIGLNYTDTGAAFPYGESEWMGSHALLSYPTNYVVADSNGAADICVNIPWTEDVVGLPFDVETAEDDPLDYTLFNASEVIPFGASNVFGSLGDDFQLASLQQPPKFLIVPESSASDDEETTAAPVMQQPPKLSFDIDRGIVELPSSSSKKAKPFSIKSLFAKEQ